MFENNVTCLQQQQQPLAIHYDRAHSHSIVVLGHSGMWAGLHVKITFSICTGYDIIIICPYVIATANVRMCTNLASRPDWRAPRD